MTAELTPNAPSPAPARAHGTPTEPSAMDILRERELARRIDAGQDEGEAWAAILTDTAIGFSEWRGKPSVPVRVAVRSYARFLRRMAPWAVEDARNRAEKAMARTAPRNAATIQTIADGKFEDPEKARIQLAGAREALKIVGIGADKQTRVTSFGVIGPAQFNFAGAARARASGG